MTGTGDDRLLMGALSERLSDSLEGPLPEGTPRRIFGRVSFPGKAAAVIDGQVVFSEELEWHPVPERDPQWHFDQIMHSLTRAAA